MIQGTWIPQTDEEAQLQEDIFLVTRHAHNQGVSKARIASLLGFMGAAAADTSVYEASAPERNQPASRAKEAADPPEEDEKTLCPECDEVIEDVVVGMGLEPVIVHPCGHEITDSMLSGSLRDWYDEVVAND